MRGREQGTKCWPPRVYVSMVGPTANCRLWRAVSNLPAGKTNFPSRRDSLSVRGRCGPIGRELSVAPRALDASLCVGWPRRSRLLDCIYDSGGGRGGEEEAAGPSEWQAPSIPPAVHDSLMWVTIRYLSHFTNDCSHIIAITTQHFHKILSHDY
jgi:hypothetical protein